MRGDGQSAEAHDPEVVALETEHVQQERDEVERLLAEVAELRASRAGVVLAADLDCRRFERHLHEGVQQHLVALAVKLQLAAPLMEADPAGAKALLTEMERDVQEALDEAARLAQRIYPPLPEPGGLGAALRSAAAAAGVHASVDVTAGSDYAPEILRTVCLCWFEVLEQTGSKGHATATVREEQGAMTFELVEAGGRSALGMDEAQTRLDGLSDRVEALGGRLRVESGTGGETRVCGRLPLPS
jgi:signal transduction histidine kinase